MNTIKSLQQQWYVDWELIVVDDGSTDQTKENILPLTKADARIKYYYKENGGVSSARNFGVRNASGDYITFLDSDDLADERWLQSFARIIASVHPSIIFCGCSKILGRQKIDIYPEVTNKWFPPVRHLFLAGTFCVKKKVFIDAGGYDESMKFSENHELGMRIMSIPGITSYAMSTLLVQYRMNGTERTSNSIDNKLCSTSRILEKYKSEYHRDKKYFAGIYSITGYYLWKKHKGSEARKHFLKSFQLFPFAYKNCLRYIRSFF